MDEERFERACAAALTRIQGGGGIGTLSEKALHAALKAYYEPDALSREVTVGGFVADIVGENGIIEIQTRSFDRFREKLAAFLECARVTVVYPVIEKRSLGWIDPDSGEITEVRTSPKHGIPMDVFPELYKIKKYLLHPNFQLRLVFLEAADYRFLNGYGDKKKIRASRGDCVPTALLGESDLKVSADYAALLPAALTEPFSSADLAKCIRRPRTLAQTALNVLQSMHAVERIGKNGRSYLYRRAE